MQSTMEALAKSATINAVRIFESATRKVPDALFFAAMDQIMDWGGMEFPEGRKFVLQSLHNLREQWDRFHPNVRKRFVENLFGHIMVLAEPKRRFLRQYLGVEKTPKEMVISPTMRCNLKCKGCYSAHYGKNDVIDTAKFDSILQEAKDIGIHFIVVSGGEPFMRDDLLDMFAKHSDQLFLVYTNGTIIYRDKLAERLAELGNVMPCLSVEGFSKETDYRRGKGVFDKIIGAMCQLREAGVMFGFSATPMRHNNEILVSDEFIEFYQNLGCFFGWYFSYMPVGRNPDLSLMPTPEQRKHRLYRIREIRDKYNILAADFWCDGPLVGGCMSAGRNYFHINAQGGIEPCVFHQFSVDNIMDTPLLEALNSPYFRHIRGQLHTIDNRYTPCPVIDNPHLLREAVAMFGSKPSQHGGRKTIEDLADGLDKYSKEIYELMQPIWDAEKDHLLRPSPLSKRKLFRIGQQAWELTPLAKMIGGNGA
ncbi:MAG: radical SAM protein [Candidatus Lernaella stagnicola]|nr:radical SAM protein [Candidatus Lernaella stagnicola]